MSPAVINYFEKTLRICVIVCFTILFVRAFIVEPGRVNGVSMETTFNDAETFLVNKYALLLRKPARGDIVQIYQRSSQKLLIKRIIGLPGEQVKVSQGKVFIVSPDGSEKQLDEPYLRPNIQTESANGDTTTYELLGPNEYFVLGDNRPQSTDSRSYGAVHRSNITGLVMRLPFVK